MPRGSRFGDSAQRMSRWKARDGSGDEIGYRVALSGDTLAVGAHTEDNNASGVNGNQANNGSTGSGADYVYQ